MKRGSDPHILIWLLAIVVLGLALYALVDYVWFLGHYVYQFW